MTENKARQVDGSGPGKSMRHAVTAACLLLAFVSCRPALADVTVKPVEKGYDIDITEETSSSEVIDAIADATGVDIKGEPEDSMVPANHLRNVSLERALRTLLPRVPFSVRFDADDVPETIIFMAKAKDDASGDTGDSAGDSQIPADPGADPMNPPLPDYSNLDPPPDMAEPPATTDDPSMADPPDGETSDDN